MADPGLPAARSRRPVIVQDGRTAGQSSGQHVGQDVGHGAGWTRARANPASRAGSSIPSGGRTARQIADQVEALQRRARVLDGDLQDLRQSVIYQLVVDEGRVSGRSLARLRPSLRTLDELDPGFRALVELLDEVSAGSSGEAPDEPGLEWLLFGPSIELAARRVAPVELLRAMEDAVRAAGAALVDMDEAWRRALPQLADCEEQVRALREQARALGSPIVSEELGRLHARLARLRSQLRTDPLGVADGVAGELVPALEGARGEMAEQRQQQQSVVDGLRRARSRLAELEETHGQVVAEARTARMHAPDPGRVVAPPDPDYLSGQPMGLEAWLARLEALYGRGVFGPTAKGLQRWTEAADDALGRERGVLAANRALLAPPRESPDRGHAANGRQNGQQSGR